MSFVRQKKSFGLLKRHFLTDLSPKQMLKALVRPGPYKLGLEGTGV